MKDRKRQVKRVAILLATVFIGLLSRSPLNAEEKPTLPNIQQREGTKKVEDTRPALRITKIVSGRSANFGQGQLLKPKSPDKEKIVCLTIEGIPFHKSRSLISELDNCFTVGNEKQRIDFLSAAIKGTKSELRVGVIVPISAKTLVLMLHDHPPLTVELPQTIAEKVEYQ